MSTALTLPNNFGAVSTLFQGQSDDNLSSGITGGFAVMSYKGKVWTIRAGGTELPLMREDGDGPRGSIEVVIVKSSPFISKVYYKNGYVPGSDEAPDCFSNNGTAPDPSIQAPQCDNCAACPMNAWGSRVNNQTGKQGKACADSKRLAIMPLEDLANKGKLGPMLLRVPAASLQDTKNYAHALKGYGYDYFTVGSRISFDAQEAFPKFIYNAIRPLSDQEAQLCLAWRNSPEVENILNAVETAPKPAAPATPFEQPPATTAPAQDGTIAAQIAALQAQLQAKAAQQAQPAAPPPPPPAPEKTAQQLEIERLQAALAAAQKPADPPPPPPAPEKTPQQLEIERLQAMVAAAQQPAPPPAPTKTPEQLQMEALQKQLAEMNAQKEAEAKAVAEKEAEKERKKAERAAKKAAEEAAKKAAEEANADPAPAPAAPSANDTLAALQAQLAALQGGQAAQAPQPTQQVLQGEVIPPAPAAENALSTASIEAKLAALMGKTA